MGSMWVVVKLEKPQAPMLDFRQVAQRGQGPRVGAGGMGAGIQARGWDAGGCRGPEEVLALAWEGGLQGFS